MMLRPLDALRPAALLLAFSLSLHTVAAPPAIELNDDPRLPRCLARASGVMPAPDLVLSSDTDGTTYLYVAGFDPADWGGSLQKRRIVFLADGNMESGATEWDAAPALIALDPDARRIYTSRTDGPALRTIPFIWDRLSGAQKAQLDVSPVDGRNDQLGEKRLAYLRGHRGEEIGRAGGPFRQRSQLLGDIINSPPAMFTTPPVMSANGYLDFYEAKKGRPLTVFVGANDGMLHAFEATTGAELFAYVPGAVFARLSRLTDTAYVHRAYVDGAIRLADVQLDAQWKTVLVAAMRGGAKGVFALDVTDPARFIEGRGALWEFTDADDPDIGNVIGAPAVARFKTGAINGAAVYRGFAIVPSGVNNYGDAADGRVQAAAYNALFLLALDKAPTERWKEGGNYFKFVLPAGASGRANGLGEPTVVYAGDGAAHYVYAADLQGNLWRFDFSGSAPWRNALGPAPYRPVFIATDRHGLPQPIMQRPTVAFAPGGYLILIGTGRLLQASDLDGAPFPPQSFYAVFDAPPLRAASVRRAQLAERTVTLRDEGNALTLGGDRFQYGDRKGWYLDFLSGNQTGERSLTPAEIADNRLYFQTFIPPANTCGLPGRRRYVLDVLAGLPPDGGVTGYPVSATERALMPSVMSPAQQETGTPDASGKRRIHTRFGQLRLRDDRQGADGEGASAAPVVEQVTVAGRLSWREIVDWEALRAPPK